MDWAFFFNSALFLRRRRFVDEDEDMSGLELHGLLHRLLIFVVERLLLLFGYREPRDEVTVDQPLNAELLLEVELDLIDRESPLF